MSGYIFELTCLFFFINTWKQLKYNKNIVKDKMYCQRQNLNIFPIMKLDVDPRRDENASPMSSYRCMLRPSYLNVYG